MTNPHDPCGDMTLLIEALTDARNNILSLLGAFRDDMPDQAVRLFQAQAKQIDALLEARNNDSTHAVDVVADVIAAVMSHVSIGNRVADDVPATRLDLTGAKQAVAKVLAASGNDLTDAKLREKYDELIYAVSIKHPQEDRHETALRYIQQAESSGGDRPMRAAETDKQGEKL